MMGFLHSRCLLCGQPLRYSTQPHDCDPRQGHKNDSRSTDQCPVDGICDGEGDSPCYVHGERPMNETTTPLRDTAVYAAVLEEMRSWDGHLELRGDSGPDRWGRPRRYSMSAYEYLAERIAARIIEASGDVPHGLDLVKAMPHDWTDEQRLAAMVEHYDRLRYVLVEGGSSGESS